MGTVELIPQQNKLIISSNFLLYGTCISENLRNEMEEEVNTMWNEVNGTTLIDNIKYNVNFKINCWLFENLTAEDVFNNKNPKNNYFRIEEHHEMQISFVDGLGSNSGYFMLTNLYKGSTTAAHEYGHTLGLEHPEDMDLRGQGIPGIMYARGTLVNPEYQYDPNAEAGNPGGTMHPMHRKVKQLDIDLLYLEQLNYNNKNAIIGKFTNVFHPKQIK